MAFAALSAIFAARRWTTGENRSHALLIRTAHSPGWSGIQSGYLICSISMTVTNKTSQNTPSSEGDSRPKTRVLGALFNGYFVIASASTALAVTTAAECFSVFNPG